MGITPLQFIVPASPLDLTTSAARIDDAPTTWIHGPDQASFVGEVDRVSRTKRTRPLIHDPTVGIHEVGIGIGREGCEEPIPRLRASVISNHADGVAILGNDREGHGSRQE